MDVRLERRRSAEEWNEAGLRRALEGRWRAARDCFEQALIRRGDLSELWVNLGVASAQLHDRDTARGAYEMARTLSSLSGALPPNETVTSQLQKEDR